MASVLVAPRALTGDGAAVTRAVRARMLRTEVFIVAGNGLLLRVAGGRLNAVNEIRVILQWSPDN